MEDLEEEEFLLSNPSIVPIFYINVMIVLCISLESISKQYDQVLPGSILTKAKISKMQTNQKKMS